MRIRRRAYPVNVENRTMDVITPYDIYMERRYSLTFRLLMSYIYGEPILDVSRSHTHDAAVGRTPLDE